MPRIKADTFQHLRPFQIYFYFRIEVVIVCDNNSRILNDISLQPFHPLLSVSPHRNVLIDLFFCLYLQILLLFYRIKLERQSLQILLLIRHLHNITFMLTIKPIIFFSKFQKLSIQFIFFFY